jgi:hypothetical protein
MITFAFDNAKVINWLRQRGTHIKNENWDGVDKINKDIGEALKKDDTLLNKLQRPCSIFVTFESEEGYKRACNYNDTIKLREYKHFSTFLEEEIEV